MKKSFFLLVLTFFILLNDVNAGENPLLFSNFGAVNLNQAAFLNPAAAAVGSGSEMNLAWSGSDVNDSNSQHIFAGHYQSSNMAEGFRYYKGLGAYQARFDWSIANGGFWNLSPGIKLSYRSFGQGEDHALMDLGLNFRPLPQLMVGYWSENFWTGGEEDRTHHFALEIKPFATLEHWPSEFLLGIKTNRPENKSLSDRQAGQVMAFTQIPLGFGIEIQSMWDWKNRSGSIGLLMQLTGSVRGSIGVFKENGNGLHQIQKGREATVSIRNDQRTPALIATGNTARLNLNQTFVEGNGGENWWQQNNEVGFLQLMDKLDVIEANPKIKSVLVELGRVHCGWSMGEEIRERLLRLRVKGKRVVVYMDQVTPLNYYLASAATVIAIQPQGYFAVTGFSTEVTFYRGLFDKLGVQPQFLRHGKYKSFEEPYMRTGFSEPAKENLSKYLSSLWDHYLEQVATSRNLSKDSLRKALESGEISLSHAKSAGLIDTVIQADEALKLAGGKFASLDPVDAEEPYQSNWQLRPKIAVIVVTGEMVLGQSSKGWLAGPEFTGSATVSEQIRQARLDSRVKAVVLRVDSPGGSAQAADMMWREVELLKQAGKPVVASVGHDAASGGYYLICGADEIFAEPNSTVGSIGVLWGKFVLRGLYEKLGLNVETVKTSPHADGLSMQRPWDSSEVKVLQNHMDQFYQDFISKVAQGRHKSVAAIDSLGQGQIFTGTQGKENGLVDQIGGYAVSISEAARRAGIKNAHGYEIEVIDPENVEHGLSSVGRNWAQSLSGLASPLRSMRPTDPLVQLENKVTPYLEQLKPGLWAISPERAGWMP